MKKTTKTVLYAGIGTAAAASALCMLTGAVIHNQVLSKRACTERPKKDLYSSFYLKKYFEEDALRIADDWFTERAKTDTVLINEKHEELRAKIVKADKASHRWAIVVHGITSLPRGMSRQGYHYFKDGYNILFPCQRAHDTSEIGSCSMGYFERFDMISWINYIISCDPGAEIILHGSSMGSGTVMMTAGENLPENVKAIVADCGYSDCYEEFTAQIENVLKLPSFPFLPVARLYIKIFHHWDIKDCSPVKAVAKSRTPILFIHGDKDTFVPFYMMQKLYDACSSEKEMLAVPGAGHDESCEKQPELYWKTADAFLKKYI